MTQVKKLLDVILFDDPDIQGMLSLEMMDGSVVSYKIIEIPEEQDEEETPEQREFYSSCEIKKLIQEFGQETIDECYNIIKKKIKPGMI